MTIRVHKGDLPDLAGMGDSVAIDTETLGLNPHRDRLCVVQISRGDGTADVVLIAPGQRRAPNIERMLADAAVTKIFHFGRFDIAVMAHAFGVLARLKPGVTMEQARAEAKTIAGRLALLNEGNIVLEGTFEELEKSQDKFVTDFMRRDA